MEYFPTSKLDDKGNRQAEIEYLTRFLRRLLNSPEGSVQCAECRKPTRVLVITTESSFVCVPCATALDIVERQSAQIGD